MFKISWQVGGRAGEYRDDESLEVMDTVELGGEESDGLKDWDEHVNRWRCVDEIGFLRNGQCIGLDLYSGTSWRAESQH